MDFALPIPEKMQPPLPAISCIHRSLGLLRLLLLRRALPLPAVVVLVRPRRAERSLGAERLLLVGDRASLLLQRGLRQRDDLLVRVLRDILRLGARRVALLRLALAGKDHELGLVELQAGDVLLETLRAAVLAAEVHRNPDRLGELLRNARPLSSSRVK